MIPDDAAPDGAGYVLGWLFYKDDAPTALRTRDYHALLKFLGAVFGEESRLSKCRFVG